MTDDNATYTVTLKASGGYDAPWIVVRADNASDLEGKLMAVGQANSDGFSLVDLVTQVAGSFIKTYRAEATGQTGPVQRVAEATGGQVQGSYAPQQQQQQQAAPAQTNGYQAQQQSSGPAPSCQHGARTHRTGTSAKGPWGAWFCSQPKGSADACPPVWDKR